MKSIRKYIRKAAGNSLFLAAFICGAFISGDTYGAGAQSNTPLIGAEAVFHPRSDFLKTFHAICDSLTFPRFGECFLSVMKSGGATPEAVAFTRLTENTGYMRSFRDTGKVDVAYVTYPFRANENQGFFLVNGNPPFIDVDNLTALPQANMKKDPRYLKIVRKYPKANLWPGDRFRTVFPENTTLPGGGQSFTVTYLLRDGCHACELLGIVIYTFDFDFSGKFLGRNFLKIVPTKTSK
jgi:hypothetical protein